MEGKKISQLTPDTSPTTDDFIVSVDGTTMENKRVDLGNLPVSNPTTTYVDNRTPIYGTGFPNGVVSATPGRIYIDENITHGASSWIKKSGTGNTGWQVLEGDTGWRNIAYLVDSTDIASTSAARIRRVNNTVEVKFDYNLVSPTGLNKEVQPFSVLPAGFNPQVTVWERIALVNSAGSALTGYFKPNDMWKFRSSEAAQNRMRSTHTTEDPWPISLP